MPVSPTAWCAAAWPEAVALVIRRPEPADHPALSDLCFRSKAVWGYDAAFMAACREELTLTPSNVAGTRLVMILDRDAPVAMAQVGPGEAADEAELWKLFVAPEAMRRGYGRWLMVWARAAARLRGAARLRIAADPGAEAFYLSQGARRVGSVPSESIPGRELPLLMLDPL